MIYLIIGANAYQVTSELEKLSGAFTGEIERFDGDEMTAETLADIARGQTLFATKRFIVIRHLSRNKAVWENAAALLEPVDDETTVVMIEQNPDKRTKVYKRLNALAKVITVAEWTDRDVGAAREWLHREAQQRRIQLTVAQEKEIVERAMMGNDAGKQVIDQNILAQVLERLPPGPTADEAIEAMLPESTYANVFGLLESAIERKTTELEQALERLRHVEDPYKMIGLIASQWSQLVAVTFADKPPTIVAADIGAAPFAVQRMARIASKLSTADTVRLTGVMAEMDIATKTTPLDPWTLLERFLRQLAARP